MLQKRYKPIHDWMYEKGEENKICYYVFSAIDILIYIISYFIMWLCGYEIG